MNGLDWVFSVVLAGVFFLVGATLVVRFEKALDLFPWVKDVPRLLAQAIGVAEILGALGLILPAATGILPWLTPLSAVALALLMLMAATFNGMRRDKAETVLNLILLAMLALVAYIRWPLMPF